MITKKLFINYLLIKLADQANILQENGFSSNNNIIHYSVTVTIKKLVKW